MGKTPLPVSWESPREATEEEVAANHGLPKQCFAAFVVSLTTLNCGFAILWMRPKSVELTAGADTVGRFTVDQLGDVMVTSHYAAILSALLLGLVVNWCGRKPALYLAAIINIIGGVIFRNAHDSTSIWAGKACASCTVVSGLLVGPMLLSEIAHKNVRGALITFCTLQFNLGIMLAYSFYYYIPENIYQIVYITIPVIQLVLYTFIPESPYFLVSKSRALEAEGSFFWSRGSNRTIAKGELKLLQKSSLATQHCTILQSIMSRATRRAFLTSMGLVFFQLMSGYLVFWYYSENIVFYTGNCLNERYTGLVIAGTRIVASLVSMCLIDLIGRKALLYVSHGGNFLTLLVLTIYLMTQKVDTDIGKFTWLPFVCMICFTAFYGVGTAPLTTVIPNEVSPIKVKGVIAAVDGLLTSILVLGVLGSNPVLKRLVGDYMNFLIPTVMNVMALVFTWAIVPETKCKSLLEFSEFDEERNPSELLKNEITHC